MIALARQDLKDVLEDKGLKVYGFPPERLEAPCIVIDTAPKVENAETFGAYALSFKLTLVVAYAGDFAIQVENLDKLLDKTLEALGNLEVYAQGHFILQNPDGQLMLAYEMTVSTEYGKEN